MPQKRTTGDIAVITSIPLVRDALLQWMPDYGWSCVAVRSVREASLLEVIPCVVVVTEEALTQHGATAAETLRGSPILALAIDETPENQAALVKLGAKAVMSLRLSQPSLKRAIQDLIDGRGTISAEALAVLAAGEPDDAGARMTERQRQVMELLSEGLSTAEIADRLCLSPSTVKCHLQRLGNQIGIRGQRALAVNARRLLRPSA